VSKNNLIPVWNLSLHQIAVIRAVKDVPPTLLERLRIKDYRKRVATDWGKRVAVFTDYQKAREYLDWSLHDEESRTSGRFKQESLLFGYDRAWVSSMWVDVPVDPIPEE
jgi:hypothetical protein